MGAGVSNFKQGGQVCLPQKVTFKQKIKNKKVFGSLGGGGDGWTRGESLEGRVLLSVPGDGESEGRSLCSLCFQGASWQGPFLSLPTSATLDLCLPPAASFLTKQTDEPFSEVGLLCMAVELQVELNRMTHLKASAYI